MRTWTRGWKPLAINHRPGRGEKTEKHQNASFDVRCFLSPTGHRRYQGFQPLGPVCERGPGAGSHWLLTIAPVGQENCPESAPRLFGAAFPNLAIEDTIERSIGNMTNKMRAAACGIFLLAAVCLVRLAQGCDLQSEAAVREVRAVLDKQVADWNKGDLDGFLSGYWNSPKVVFMSGGQRFDGYEAMRDRYRRRYKAEGRAMGQLAFSELDLESAGARIGAGPRAIPADHARRRKADRALHRDLPQAAGWLEDRARPYFRRGSASAGGGNKAGAAVKPARLLAGYHRPA